MHVLLFVGEKSIVKSGSYMLNNKDLTGAAIYNADHDIDMIQPLRVAPEIEQEQRGKQDDGNDFGIEVEKWLSMCKSPLARMAVPI